MVTQILIEEKGLVTLWAELGMEKRTLRRGPSRKREADC